MSEWSKSNVDELFDMGRGRVISGIEIANNPGDYPVFSSQTSNGGCMGFIGTYDFEGDLITWTTDGANAGTVFYRNGKYNCTNVCGTLKAKSDGIVDHRFFASLLSTLAKKHVSYIGNPKLMNGVMGKIEVRYPPINEQKKISQVIDTLDIAIQKTEVIVKKLKQVKQGLLHDLMTRGVDANSELRPSYEQAPHLYKESSLGWIPKEWGVDTLFKACSLIRDGTHLPPARVSVGPLLLSVRNMKDGKFVLTDQDTRVSKSFYNQMHKNWVIEKGDLLLAIVGATIGKIALVGEMPKFTLQRSVAVLRGKEGRLRNRFMFAFLGTPEFQNALWAQVNQTAQPGIYLDQLGSISISLPPDPEQQVIVDILTSIESKITQEEATLGKMRKQKSGLMDDLLTGHVRVTPLLAQSQ
jgi:type I restriction enzyme, S subunit